MRYGEFKKTVWDYYKKNRRDFPWRHPYLKTDTTITPYHITVSEIMLQQTQAQRVISKYSSFIKKFPNFETLAHAPLNNVLKEWKGLGYNRRALNLHRLAKEIIEKHKGILPHTYETLLKLPGIGPGTAGSIIAFTYNIAHPFIETNIRSVFIHHFSKKSDKDILRLVEATLEKKYPRDWYYALMDYGVMLKKLYKNPARKSLHYKKQSPFKGSSRELRARILHEIVLAPSSLRQIAKNLERQEKDISIHLEDLINEGFIIKKRRNLFSVA